MKPEAQAEETGKEKETEEPAKADAAAEAEKAIES